jgi:hypothetical protein
MVSLSDELVSNAAYGHESHGLGGLDFQMFSKPANVDVHGARGHKCLRSPNAIEELIAGENLASVSRQKVQKSKLFWS